MMLPEKYKALFIFLIFTMNNGFAWLMFDPVAGWLEENVVGLGRTKLELLSSWQPIVFLCMCIPVMKIVTRFDGLRIAVRLGTSCEVVGAVLKCIGSLSRRTSAGLFFLNIGQIFSGIGSPVATGCVSALSATWFEPEERTRATAAAVLLNTVGNALCYLIIPVLTKNFSFSIITFYEIFMAIIAVVAAWMVMPQEVEKKDDDENSGAKPAEAAKPAATTTAAGGEEEKHKDHVPLIQQVKQFLRIKSCVCLIFVYAWLCGGFAAWVSLFAATYNRFYPEEFIGLMSFFAMSAYVAGGIVSSILVDMYFPRQMKYVVFFCIVMATLSNLIFIACTPNDKGYCLWDLGRVFIVFSTAMCGLWNGAAAPLFFELVAEISYPVEEGVSGTCTSIMENLGALLFYQIISRLFHGQSMSVAYSFGMTVAVALTAAVKQRYNRTYHAYLLEQEEGGIDE